MLEISDRELEILNFYRASELEGGLLLGQMVRRARDAQLALELTRHSAEEVGHAQLWTETIIAVGGGIRPVRNTYQARYARVIGAPVTMLQVLALTQVFERRVYRHFTEHLRLPGTHQAVRATLQRMLDEEKGHLRWVKTWLDRQAMRGADVTSTMRQYAKADAEIYEELTRHYAWRQAA